MGLICVDLGATNIRAGLPEDVSAPRFATKTPASADLIVNAIAEAVAAMRSEIGRSASSVAVGCPGLIEADGSVRAALHLPLGGCPLASELRARIGVPVSVINDAQAQAVGTANGLDECVFYLALGTGVGGAIVDRGKLVSGNDGWAGEVGHIPLRVSRIECQCGGIGCLDTTASGIALERELGPDWYATPATSRVHDVLRSAGHDVGLAASLGAILLNPSAVVVAGKTLCHDPFRAGVLDGWRCRAWAEAELRLEIDTWPLALRGLTRLFQQRGTT